MVDYPARADALHRFADRLQEESDALAAALVRDVEITRKSAQDRDLRLGVHLLRQYRADADFEKDPEFQLEDRRPFGQVAVMLPYNSVGVCGAMAVGGAYLAGNETIHLRLPSKIPTFRELYRPIIEDALPGVRVVDTSGPEFLSSCFSDPEVRAVLVFGDDRWMVRYRGAVRRSHTRLIFEGPGKDPFMVFADADVERAAEAAVAAGTANSGQSCSSPERFYVEASVAEPFVARAVEHMQALAIGRASDPDTDIGPIGSDFAASRIRQQLQQARDQGASFICGGSFVSVEGNRLETCLPTVVVGCTPEMSLIRDETFGPVIPVVTFETEDQALELVDDTRYGLTATVFGGSNRAHRFLEDCHGNVFRDSCIADPEHASCRLFWGGFRRSAWIWGWEGSQFVHKEGPRYFVKEFSRPAATNGKAAGLSPREVGSMRLLSEARPPAAERSGRPTAAVPVTTERLRAFFRDHGPGVDDRTLASYFEPRSVLRGHRLIERHDSPDELYLIESGQLSAWLEVGEEDSYYHLRNMGPGEVVGELGVYLGQPRTALVVADEPTLLHRLTGTGLERLEREQPGLASVFHHSVARMLAKRLVEHTELLEQLLV